MTNWIFLFFQEVLGENRLKLLPKLVFFKDLGFYLAWWTALALQFGHRQSVDFDFFISKEINTEELFNQILEEFKNEKVIKTFEEKNTLYLEINDIKISFMTYKYDLLESLIETDFLNISSFVDIWVMKLWAIQNRATNKDYVDIYYILQKINILDLIQKFNEKFWKVVSENIILKSLVYFDDIDEEELIMNDKKTFEEIKNHLILLSKNI